MNTLQCWQRIQEWLLQNQAVVVVFVVNSTKGSPGNAGQMMAITSIPENGISITGTIGGGIMERRVIDELTETLSRQQTVCTLRTLHHSTHTRYEQSGLICSGSQTMINLTLKPDNIPLVNEIITALKHRENKKLRITSDAGMSIVQGNNNQRFDVQTTTSGWCFEESLALRVMIYIIGNGHVGFALARQAELLGFDAILIGERPVPAQYAGLDLRSEQLLMPFEALGSYIPESLNSCIIIVTSAFTSDIAVLQALRGNQYGYIGLMGSAAKLSAIFQEARRRGCSEEWLQTISAPAGLPINSDTPQEIAVSICAELIAVQNGEFQKILKKK